MTASNRKLCRFSSLLLLMLLLWADAAMAKEAGTSPETFYDDAKRGWFWYEKRPEPPPEAPPEESVGLPAVFIPKMSDYTTEQLWSLHPDHFKALLEGFQKKAVMEPSVENMRDYMKMQDMARRKSAEFAMVTNYTIQANPDLDLNRDYPVTTPGKAARTRQQKSEIQTRLASASQDHALLYFYAPSCGFCDEQDGILRYFVERSGWEVRPINIEAQPQLAARFNIETTPSLLLIKRGNDDYIPTAVGVVSVEALEDRLYRGVRLLNGEITPQEYALYDYQRGGPMDPQSILRQPQQ